METLDFVTMAIMAGMGFVAAFIDSVVGGGGLISVPVLMWAGLPMLNVLGTNKIASTMGAAYVRPLFIAMTTILIGKQLIELFK